jgi:DNA polymerase (family X)
MQHSSPSLPLSNAEIADRLSALAQLLTVEKANPYKVRAYRRAAAVVRGLGESVDELVRSNEDLRVYPGIGDAMNVAIREIVETGTLRSLEKLRLSVSPELLSLTEYPRLDPKRILRIYKKLKISSIEGLGEALKSGELERVFGVRMAQHVSLGLVETETVLLYHAHPIATTIRKFLLEKCGAKRAEAVGEYRRLVETISKFDFLVETSDFSLLVEGMKSFGGKTPLVEATKTTATYALSSGPLLCIEFARNKWWGLDMIRSTGSGAHLRKLTRITGSLTALSQNSRIPDEQTFYRQFAMQWIPPELREGLDEVSRARKGTLPHLVRKRWQ